MTDLAELRSTRTALSPAARALRLQRIFARLQEGASYKDMHYHALHAFMHYIHALRGHVTDSPYQSIRPPCGFLPRLLGRTVWPSFISSIAMKS